MATPRARRAASARSRPTPPPARRSFSATPSPPPAPGGGALPAPRLAGPVVIFVYGSRDDFFGALGPGAREWTGAATFPWLRTIFMWLGGGSTSFLQTTIIHEATHVVFQ